MGVIIKLDNFVIVKVFELMFCLGMGCFFIVLEYCWNFRIRYFF